MWLILLFLMFKGSKLSPKAHCTADLPDVAAARFTPTQPPTHLLQLVRCRGNQPFENLQCVVSGVEVAQPSRLLPQQAQQQGQPLRCAHQLLRVDGRRLRAGSEQATQGFCYVGGGKGQPLGG